VGDQRFVSSEIVGEYYSIDDIIQILENESIFFNQSGGGVTFSGGEPMLQFDFLFEALKACKAKGFHTALDTSGYSSIENYRSILPYTDLFLFDIKHMDNLKHNEYTGVSNKEILDNYRFILNSGKDVMVRVPIIPSINDDTDHMENMRRFLSQTKTESLKKINLLPYHKIGSSKYKRFNLPYRMGNIEPPSKEKIQELRLLFAEVGVKVKIGG
jgi:pyruvate formate lyase activating enzyme